MRARSTRQCTAPAPSSSRHTRIRRATLSGVSRRPSPSPKVRWCAHETLTIFMYPVRAMRRSRLLVVALVFAAVSTGRAWDLPQDNGTLGRQAIAEILAAQEFPATSSYSQRTDFIDFTAHGQPFTQVVVTLTPDKPRLHNGKRLGVVGGQAGSEYGMDFISTVEKRDGPGIWLARRGITFVALTRVGRWNFLAPTGDGSWESVALQQRMPIFTRTQKTYWAPADYEMKSSGVAQTNTPSASAFSRFPKKGTALEGQILRATPAVFLEGYRLALEKAITDRRNAFVPFWGVPTGGASLYPLAKYYMTDGYLGWG